MMAEKHYNINYLQETAKVMQGLKLHSYTPLENLQEGIILDIGCGTGIDVINLAKLLTPRQQIIGIDHDKEMIEKALSSSLNIENVTFIKNEVYNLPFEDQSIQGIRAERLFQHLKHQEKAYLEIRRVLKENAPLVIVETDWNSLSFYNVNDKIEKQIHDYLVEKKVVNGLAAKQLANNLMFHGFKEIKFEVFPMVVHSFQEACSYLWIDKIIEEMKVQNLISNNEYADFMNEIKESDKNNYFHCSLNITIASGIK